MITKTLVPQINGTYSSFPTFTEHGGKIFVFYRQSAKSDIQCHGIHGKVKCFEIEKDLFLNMFRDDKEENLYAFGKDYTVFESENEMDAIVSRLDDNVYSLCTRKYIDKRPLETYISFSDTPNFKDRHEVKIKDIDWFAFYGKAFKWKQGYVYPAYGDLKGERPLLLITDDFSSWELLSYLPGGSPGFALNESSIVFDGERYIIFMREDTEPLLDDMLPFGIWYSTSTDLQNWSTPKKLLPQAHAPMSVYKDGKIFLVFRELVSENSSAVTLMSPFLSLEKTRIETYKGSPYDGGYSDICFIDNRMFIVYYTGNESGEPYLRICEADSSTEPANPNKKQNEKFIAL